MRAAARVIRVVPGNFGEVMKGGLVSRGADDDRVAADAEVVTPAQLTFLVSYAEDHECSVTGRAMIRERGLKIVLVLVGLLFSAAIYPVIGGLRDPANSDTGDTMMMGLYFVLGIFLLIAVRNPPAHRSLIAFAAWSSFAHAVVMSTLGFEIATERAGFLGGSAVLVVIGVALIALAPQQAEQASASAA